LDHKTRKQSIWINKNNESRTTTTIAGTSERQS